MILQGSSKWLYDVIPDRRYLFGTIYYILYAMYLNIIEIYVYLNKLGSIACYLAYK